MKHQSLKHFLLYSVLAFTLLSCVVAAGGQTLKLVAGGDGAQASLDKPFAVTFDKEGNLYIGEFGGCRVRKIDDKGTLTTIAGTGVKGFGGDGGPAEKGQFNLIHDIVFGPDGNLYVADSDNHRVRKIDMKTGVLSTFAGDGRGGKGVPSSGDGGPADRATLDGVASLWFEPSGKTLLISGFSKVVRTVDMSNGTITTVKDLPGGRSIAVDSKGNLYVAGGTSLRVRTASGQVRTLLDKTHLGGSNLPLGDNPKHLAIDSQDNVIIADEAHHMIRRYSPADGKLETIAGTGKLGTAGIGGPPDKAQLNRPHGVYVHPTDGRLYIADSWNNRVLLIAP